MPPLMMGLTNLPKLWEGGVPPGPHGSDNPAQATTMSTLEINDASRSLGLCLSIAKEYISTYLECQDFQIDSYLSIFYAMHYKLSNTYLSKQSAFLNRIPLFIM